MFGVRELNVAIELWGVLFCLIGIVCVLLLARTEKRYRNIFLMAFSMELLACAGDAVAGIFRGQDGGLAWAMTHVGNRVTFIGGFMLVAIIAFYVCARVSDSGGSRYRSWPVAVGIAAIVMSVLALMGAFFWIDDGNLYHRGDWYWISQAFVFVVNVVNAGIVIRERGKLGRGTLICLLVYTIAPIAASLVQTFVYGLNFAILVAVGALMVVFLEMWSYSAELLVTRTEELAASRVEVSESRIAVMVSQIQPHFLFNTLDTIYGLVDENTEKAKAAIASFSRYLRANLDSLKHVKPVPIDNELEHVRTYLELERMSDEGRLVYELDIQDRGFSVPALSVQTLAENAVKHGLGGREEGGKVIVRTREQATEHTVAIVDNGVGFDEALLEGAAGVGISNTRARLAAMCGGTLDVTSVPGEGTTVVMHVPKSAGEGSRS